ncbi:alpha/beta fold hydrolase [Pelomonas sp. V22]|uniref:alpha/beta hydrolase n=1 Tax=Pelomonas sp. V22 TaxID=2822139 RepID=UPI0024A8F445|nr:alpha/beta fold hydrolase [Pelomonas sp. V22]MDI4635052.1 alpha/beta fold hydrolase [Pelomonas sp. V22]
MLLPALSTDVEASLQAVAPDPRPAVLLLHGLRANPLELMPLARVLRAAGYVVEVPPLPGYGVIPGGPADAAVPPWEQWLAQAREHYDALAERHGQVVLGGLCMGAVLSLALSRQRPAAALLLISTTLHFDGWNVSPWRRLLPLAYLPPLRGWLSFKETEPFGLKNERLREWVAQAMQSDAVSAAGAARLPAASLYQASRLLRHVRKSLPEIEVPALVLHASEDEVSGPRSVRELEQRLGQAPEVHWFHDSYHMLTLDNERVAVAHAARDFLQRLVPAPLPAAD